MVLRPVARAFRPKGFRGDGEIVSELGTAAPSTGASCRKTDRPDKPLGSRAEGALVKPDDRGLSGGIWLLPPVL